MNTDWMPVIAISVAVMALVQVGTVVGLFVAVRRIQTGVKDLEKRVETAVEEFRPQLTHLVEEAGSVSATAQHVLTDVRRHLEAAEETARTMRQRMNRVVDGVQSVAGNLPVPMKVSGPAAVAVWAGLRLAQNALGQMRERRRERGVRDRQYREAESYIGTS